MDINIMADILEKVAKSMQGAAGPGGIDATSCQYWTLWYAMEKLTCITW